ncbi:MAG: glycosyltransferase family 2 protein [Lachnospiraceae bacterium]|nr:glycosyltransferase family 2 protein [Lachnospiraceae bacterium]MDD3661045.1 glycosyltransferase family 2 protein [Lachnospiraceae bacterium]
MKSIIIIPAYNEEKSILDTVEDIKKYAPEFDYIVVNDCSADQTLQVCRQNRIPCLDLPVNLGIGGAVQTGYHYAKENGYQIAVQFDGDGQHDAKYLDTMKRVLLEQNADMVIGSRFIEKEGFQSSGLRRMGIRYFTILIRILTGVRITDPTSGMRMAGSRAITIFAEHYPKDYPEPESVVAAIRQGLNVKEIPVVMRSRMEGVSSISAGRSIYYMIKVTLAIFLERLRRY